MIKETTECSSSCSVIPGKNIFGVRLMVFTKIAAITHILKNYLNFCKSGQCVSNEITWHFLCIAQISQTCLALKLLDWFLHRSNEIVSPFSLYTLKPKARHRVVSHLRFQLQRKMEKVLVVSKKILYLCTKNKAISLDNLSEEALTNDKRWIKQVKRVSRDIQPWW